MSSVRYGLSGARASSRYSQTRALCLNCQLAVEQEAQSICAKIIALRGDRLEVEVDEVTDLREIVLG
jgi:hypothetical protein